MLLDDVVMQVLNQVRELSAEDGLEVDIHALLKVVESVDKGSDVPLQRPAGSGSLQVGDQEVERIPFDQFADVHRVVIVDQRRHDLEKAAEVS